MDESIEESEELEANELLDETQRLRHKRDLLTKENEQLKSYLRLRQMESTATCEQLKSEIEQQIEQFEALGDTQTNHLETLKSFRSEIEAIQCWNAKIRNKYFARNNTFGLNSDNTADELTDELIEEMVSAGGSSRAIDSNIGCDNHTNEGFVDNTSNDLSDECKQTVSEKPIEPKIKTKSNSEKVENDLREVQRNSNSINSYNIITRSKQKSNNNCLDNKRKQNDKNESQRMSKRKKK